MRLAGRSRTPTRRAERYAEACQLFTKGYAGKLQVGDSADRRAYAMASAMLCAALALLNGAELDALNQHIDLLRERHADDTGWEEHCTHLLDEIDRLGLSTSFWHYTNSLELISARALLRVAISLSLARLPKLDATQRQWRDAPTSALPQVQADVHQGQRLLRHALVRWPSPVEAESISERFVAMARACRQQLDAPAKDHPELARFRDQLAALAALAAWAVDELASDKTAAR
jgi:hypothetical protein